METTEQILKSKRKDLHLVSPYNIIIEEGFNARTDYGDIDGLKESIINSGQLEPVIAYKKIGTDQWVLTDGHRRYTAIMKAITEGHDIPYIELKAGSSNPEERLFAMVITGVDKKPLSVLEEAETYKRLIKLGYNVATIKQKVGKSTSHIYSLLEMSELPQLVKNEIADGKISASVALQLSKNVNGHEELTATVQNAVANSDDKKGKKVKLKDIGLPATLSLSQKFKEALIIMEQSEYPNGEKGATILSKLTELCNDKKTTPKDIFDLFQF
jgi:ParB/RepB/Spo0J family partition protein